MLKYFSDLWHSNWKNKLTMVAGALILVAAIVATIYAVATREGDVGFLEIEDGKTLQWEREDLPILCLYAASVDTYLQVFDAARKEINQRVGKTLIAPCLPWLLTKPFPSKPLKGHVLLHVGVTPEPDMDGLVVKTTWQAHPGGSTFPYYKKAKPGALYGAIVWIAPEYGENFSVWLHELGHVLGLDHDRCRDSVMWPTIQERPGSLSNKDVTLLQKAYTP